MATQTSNERVMMRGSELRSVLEAQGRRKDWLAAQAGIHPSLLSHAMAGRRSVTEDVAERMAAALQVPFFLLFDRSGVLQNRTESNSEDAA